MNPSDANSSLATLRQLKEMLDAGALTPQEFEALKQQLVFGKAAAPDGGLAAPDPNVAAFGPPVAVSEALTSAPGLPGEAGMPLPTVEMPDWLTAPAPSLGESPSATLAESDYPEDDARPAEGQRGSLNLVFAIGGALVFLAVVLYLTLGNRSPDEHLTSTTQTAADSTAVAPEVGPQAQQLTLPPVTPETVRVAP
ncbi:MAG: SHOCT domain-containing protein, partial [Hymenobacter sp.]